MTGPRKACSHVPAESRDMTAFIVTNAPGYPHLTLCPIRVGQYNDFGVSNYTVNFFIVNLIVGIYHLKIF